MHHIVTPKITIDSDIIRPPTLLVSTTSLRNNRNLQTGNSNSGTCKLELKLEVDKQFHAHEVTTTVQIVHKICHIFNYMF